MTVKKTKADLINQVYENTSLSKASIAEVINQFISELVSEIEQGHTVRIPELGVFKVTTRKPYDGRNPATGESVPVPERYVPRVKFCERIRDNLNKTK